MTKKLMEVEFRSTKKEKPGNKRTKRQTTKAIKKRTGRQTSNTKGQEDGEQGKTEIKADLNNDHVRARLGSLSRGDKDFLGCVHVHIQNLGF